MKTRTGIRRRKKIVKYLKAGWLILVAIASMSIVLYDLYFIMIHPFITKEMVTFTPYGIIEFIVALYFIYDIIFREE